MSSATLVPETRELTGDDAIVTLRRTGEIQLARDAFVRLRSADGFSHARSLAFLTSLVAIQALIGLVGLASVIHQGSLSRVIDQTIRQTIPGPAGHVLTTTVTHANLVGAHHHYGAVLIGLLGSLITASTAMGQVERGLNRVYGIEHDRPLRAKYSRAFVSALGVGTLTLFAFICLALGNDVVRARTPSSVNELWSVLRWPLGVVLIACAVTVMLRWTPRRRQPHLSWLSVASATSVLLWVVSTVALGLFFRFSSTFGSTYGPLAGVVALLLWSLLASVSLLYGAAVAAQLEVVRADTLSPDELSTKP